MERNRLWMVLVLATALTMAGCAQPPETPPGDDGTTPPPPSDDADDGTTPPPGPTVLRVGTEAEFPPFESIDEDGNFVGYDIDVMEEVGRRAGWMIEWSNVGFDVLIPQVQAGQLDAAISAMTIRPDRAEIVDFSIPYFVAENQAVTKRADDERNFTSLEDLAGLRVGVQRGTTGQFYMEEEDVTVVHFDAYPTAIQALRIGEVDVVVMDAPAQERAVDEDPAIVIAFLFPVEEEYGIVVQKGRSEVLGPINDALESMIDDGTIDQLRAKWGI